MKQAQQTTKWKRTSKIVTIIQGKSGVSDDPDVVFSTILGSCVSVAFFDDVARVGGLNHYLLPASEGDGRHDVKYGAMAIELLVNDMLKAGAIRSRLRAKLFGGANIIAGLGNVGARNAKFARDFMQREGFRVAAEDLGGRQARRLQFHPVTGNAKVIKVPIQESAPVALTETPAPVVQQQDVTLF